MQTYPLTLRFGSTPVTAKAVKVPNSQLSHEHSSGLHKPSHREQQLNRSQAHSFQETYFILDSPSAKKSVSFVHSLAARALASGVTLGARMGLLDLVDRSRERDLDRLRPRERLLDRDRRSRGGDRERDRREFLRAGVALALPSFNFLGVSFLSSDWLSRKCLTSSSCKRT
jgi:hypothetical protein